MWVNHMWPQLSVAYYTPELDGVDSWAMVWEPRFAERVLVPHPSSTQGPITLVVGAHLATGAPFSEAQYDLDSGFAKLAELKPNLLDAYPGSAQAAPLIEQGEAWLAVGFFSSYVFPRKDAGAPVDLARPKEGSFALPMGMAKVNKARNPELADAWINTCLGNEFQTIWTEKFYGSPTNREVPLNPAIVPADQLFALDWTFFSEKLQEIIDRFDREIMG
jgi:putative spermidine/putrescine transport system substrate-binding protein